MPATKNSYIDDIQKIHNHIQRVHMEKIVDASELAIAITLDKGARQNLTALWKRYGIASHAMAMIAEQKRRFLVEISAASKPSPAPNIEANEAVAELLAWRYTSTRMGNIVLRTDKGDRHDKQLLNSYEAEIEKRVSTAIKRETRITTKTREEARALRNRIKKLEKEKRTVKADCDKLEEIINELRVSLKQRSEEKDELRETIIRLENQMNSRSPLADAASSKVSTKLDPDLPVPIAFALSHLHLIPNVDDPADWKVGPDDAPNATCWNTLMLAARTKDKFAQEVMAELIRVKREREKFDRDKEVKELAARLRMEGDLEAIKLKAKVAQDSNLDIDGGLNELDDILVDEQYDEDDQSMEVESDDGRSLNSGD